MQLNHRFMCLDITRRDIITNLPFHNDHNWDEIVIAVLGCADEFGYVGIPLRRLGSGEYERSAIMGLNRLRIRTSEQQPIQNVLVRAQGAKNMDRTMLQLRPAESPPDLLIKSLPVEESSYYISGSYPPNFISAPGDKPTLSEALSRINKATSIVTPIIIFFSHERSTDLQSFAIRFDRFGSNLSSKYHIRCRVGPLIKDWEKGGALASQEHDHIVGVDADAHVRVSEDRCLIVRRRQALSQSQVLDFVNISIESRLPWQM